MTHQEKIAFLLECLRSGDVVSANEIYEDLMTERVSYAVEEAKQYVAENMFSTEECEDCEKGLVEAMKEKKEKKEEKEDEDENEGEDEGEDEDEDEDEDEAPKKKLFGKQSKLDKNKNGKLDQQDFKMLRAKKTVRESLIDALRGRLIEGLVKDGNKVKKKEYVNNLARQTPWKGPRPSSATKNRDFHSSRTAAGRAVLKKLRHEA